MSIVEEISPLYTMIILISEEGSVIKCLQDQTGQVMYRTTEVLEYEGDLYLGSFVAPFVGKLKLQL